MGYYTSVCVGTMAGESFPKMKTLILFCQKKEKERKVHFWRAKVRLSLGIFILGTPASIIFDTAAAVVVVN